MPTVVQDLKTQLAELPRADREEVLQYLISSLDQEVDPDAGAAWDAVLKRREQEILSDSFVGIPAETVFARLRARYR